MGYVNRIILDRARSNLTARYGITLESPTVVEIFPEQKDFGVRTFGMPHNPGFLGVCFGRVVTANSPASPGATAAAGPFGPEPTRTASGRVTASA